MVNGQGDVLKLLHGTNKTVAEYTYDAYGNILTTSPAQSDDPTIAAQNPLRYRGYYCDTETGFYYLQSRYYDPAIRRFLNADSYGSTGQGLLGYNMFAYCGNNPVISSDPSGHIEEHILPGWAEGSGYDYGYIVDCSDHLSTVSGTFVDSIKNTARSVCKFLTNSDPSYCQKRFFSLYKGAPVFNINTEWDFAKKHLGSFSFGIIVMFNKQGKTEEEYSNTLKHEYGHYIQLRIVGLRRYITKIAVPSIAYNLIDSIFIHNRNLYYSWVWGRSANLLGNSEGINYVFDSSGVVSILYLFSP